MREATEMSLILEKLLTHYYCSDIFQLPTVKWKGHDADENIFQLLVGKCGGGYTGSDKPIADFFARITARSVYFAERMAERLAGTDGVEVEVAHAAMPYWKKGCSNETDCVNQRGEMK